MPLGRDFAGDAFQKNIPMGAVYLACRNWGMNHDQASDRASIAGAEAICRSLDVTFENERHFNSWVTTTAIRLAIEHHRRNKRIRSLDAFFDSGGPEPAANPPGPREAIMDLNDVLTQLTERERTILTLSYEQDMTLEEMVPILFPDVDASMNARRLRVKRERDLVLKKIRGYLDKKPPDGDSRTRM